ncbi:MAG: hypothetical protein ABEJ98_02765 [Candidatus Nanohaloarchaea archaeon]
MKIGIDFDRVLFNTERFKKHLEEQIPGFSRTYDRAREDGVYNPARHADILGVEVAKIFQEIENAKNFLYPDVEELESVDEEVIIVSRGDPEFQAMKIEESGVLEHLDGYTVVQEEDKQVEGIQALIDDREVELDRVDVPGYLFSRQRDTLEDARDWIREVRD